MYRILIALKVLINKKMTYVMCINAHDYMNQSEWI